MWSLSRSTALRQVKHTPRWQAYPRMSARFATLQPNSRVFNVSEEIIDAVHTKKPIVALESTIYTHGLPYPDNLRLAYHLESLVRENGAVPATCAVLDGVARVGLGREELQTLVEASGVRKVSRRDLSFLIGKGLSGKSIHGGTTISGTMILARLAGIKVFATGGLGGVHRGGETSMDISADLTELGRTPVAVISSGPKGFLDIPRTLEYLETQGALVGTFADGREGNVDFPAFWARDSGIKSPMTLSDEAEAAAIIYAHHALPLSSGIIFANPVPAEHSIPVGEMVDMIQQALDAAVEAGATGNRNTPFVLNAIRQLSGGRSVVANQALVNSNVIRGARVAVELSKLERSGGMGGTGDTKVVVPERMTSLTGSAGLHTSTKSIPVERVDLLVAGSLAVDVSCDYKPPNSSTAQLSPQPHTSNPSSITDGLGGVAHNIARAAHLMGASVRLCSAVADDLAGKSALDALESSALDTSAINVAPADSGARTARYVCINDASKNLVMAMSDMSIMERQGNDFDSTWRPHMDKAKPKWLVVDANWNADTLHNWLATAKAAGISTAFEPVSNAKALRLLQPRGSESPPVHPNPCVDMATPNALELQSMYDAARASGLFERDDWWKVLDALGIPSTGARTQFALMTSPALVDAGIPQQAISLLPFIPCLLVKVGPDGVLLVQLLRLGDERLSSAEAAPYVLSRSQTEEFGVGGIYMRLFPAAEVVPEADIVSVNGVGDTFLGALMAGLTRIKGSRVEDLVAIAQRASVLTLKSKEAVSPEIAKMQSSLATAKHSD